MCNGSEGMFFFLHRSIDRLIGLKSGQEEVTFQHGECATATAAAACSGGKGETSFLFFSMKTDFRNLEENIG